MTRSADLKSSEQYHLKGVGLEGRRIKAVTRMRSGWQLMPQLMRA